LPYQCTMESSRQGKNSPNMYRAKFGVFLWGCAVSLGCISFAFAQKPLPNVGPPVDKPAAIREPNFAPKSSATPEGIGQPIDPNKYLIGAEDLLFIQVWREVDFTRPAAVRPDGKITMPLIGDVQAGGLTPQQLTQVLVEKLGSVLTHPEVTVTVSEVRSKKYYIDGEVNHPGFFPLVTPTRVLEALSNAGGFRDFANTKRIKILRGDQVFNFNYNDVSKGKHMEQNIFIENGDHIIVK